MKNSNDFRDFEAINQNKFNNNLDVFRDMSQEDQVKFVEDVKNKYSK